MGSMQIPHSVCVCVRVCVCACMSKAIKITLKFQNESKIYIYSNGIHMKQRSVSMENISLKIIRFQNFTKNARNEF